MNGSPSPSLNTASNSTLDSSKPFASTSPFRIREVAPAGCEQVVHFRRQLDSINLSTERNNSAAFIQQSRRFFVRFLYLAMSPERFEDRVPGEMLPGLTEDWESLFWECYGKRVTRLSFRKADKLSVTDKEFIEARFPPYSALTVRVAAGGPEADWPGRV